MPANAIAESHGDSTLGGGLSDNVLVELDHDLARLHVVKCGGKKFFFFPGDGAVAAGCENYFFVGLTGHSRLSFPVQVFRFSFAIASTHSQA